MATHEPDNPGPATDRQGDPVKDPTENVLDILRAAVRRQDDLRQLESSCLREVMQLRADFDKEKDGLNKEIRRAESSRIDAIRAVDVGAVNRAAEVSAAKAQTLATQVATSAEALRGQVEAARQQTANSLAAALEPIQKDVADLRRVQYEQAGEKGSVAVTKLDTRSNSSDVRAMIAIAIASLSTIAAIVLGILAAVHR